MVIRWLQLHRCGQMEWFLLPPRIPRTMGNKEFTQRLGVDGQRIVSYSIHIYVKNTFINVKQKSLIQRRPLVVSAAREAPVSHCPSGHPRRVAMCWLHPRKTFSRHERAEVIEERFGNGMGGAQA